MQGSKLTSLRLIFMKSALLITLLLFLLVPAHAKRHPNLVPKGWIQEILDPESKTRGFSSPDGRSWLMTKQTEADQSSVERDMDEIAYQEGERITYQRRGTTWIAVSGYRDDRIFYRKSNLACGGTRWLHIELQYPREIKRQMDATVTAISRVSQYSDDCPPAIGDHR